MSKIHQNTFSDRAPPRTRWVSLFVPQTLYTAAMTEPTYKGMEGRGGAYFQLVAEEADGRREGTGRKWMEFPKVKLTRIPH